LPDAYPAIEAHVVAIGEFLEKARRYRPLAAEALRLYQEAARIAAEVRRVSRARETIADPAPLEARLGEIVANAERALDEILAGPGYRAVAEAASPAAGDLTALFADVEAAAPSGRLYLPLVAKRGKDVLEPDAAAEMVASIAADGIEPQRGPGVGGDDHVHPIRFFETLDGIEAPMVLIVAADAIVASGAPVLRASELGEILVYARRLALPFVVGLRDESPDDWLEIRAGGYPEYRDRCRGAIESAGFATEKL
jgi:hypothetical protein